MKLILCLLFAAGSFLVQQWQCSCPDCTQSGSSLSCADCSCTQTTPPIPPTNIIRVPKNANLQAYLDMAKGGDVIVLENDSEYTGNFVLRDRPGSGPIVLTADTPPAAGRRVGMGEKLPRIVASGTAPGLYFPPKSHDWRVEGLEIAASGYYSYGIVRVGASDSTQTKVENQPRAIVLDRIRVMGDPVKGSKNGIELHGQDITVQHSRVTGIFSTSQETHSIAGWNGSGPYVIWNNYLGEASIGVLFGGARPQIQGVTASNIKVYNNYFSRPLSWKGKYGVKNLFELKNAQDVEFYNNVVENNWTSMQAGIAVLFTVTCDSGGTPWAVVRRVKMHHNYVYNAEGGVNFRGQDSCGDGTYVQASDVEVYGNLFDQIIQPTGSSGGKVFQVLNGYETVSIHHNTVGKSQGSPLVFDGKPIVGLVFQANILPHNRYGVFGSGMATGTASLEKYAPGYIFTGNVLWGQYAKPSAYPPGNYLIPTVDGIGFVDYANGNYALTSSSPYQGLGADIVHIDKVRASVPVGLPVQ